MGLSQSSRQERPDVGGMETASFEQVFREQVSYVWRSLKYLGVPESDLEDVCQEVFLVVHRKLPEFEGRASIRTWIYGICIRVAAGQRRRAYVRREKVTDAPPEKGREPSQVVKLGRRQERELLRRALDELDDDKRAVFVLADIEERPMAEVAEILACPLRTAYSRLDVARKQLTRAFKRAQLKEAGR